MIVDVNVATEFGLKKDEYEKICKLLKRIPNITELSIFQQCGMSIALINRLKCI